MNKAMELARELGFETVREIDVKTLEVMQEVRDMCAECHAYGKKWSCPPACGTVEECRGRIEAHRTGFLVQSIGQLEDSWDYEGIQALEKVHKQRFEALAEALVEQKVLSLSAGGCSLCKTCAYPEPCRMPHRLMSSMEANGLLVNKICTDNGIQYYYGPNTMAFSSCILFP